MRTVRQWNQLYMDPEFQRKYIYDQDDLGAVCDGEGTSFKLWSPFAGKVILCLYQDGCSQATFSRMPMTREEKGVWSFRTDENLHGIYYDYEIEIDGETTRSADPYARACGVNGLRSMAVDLRRTDPDGWEEDKAPALTEEQIIYELHVKEFSWDKSGGFPEEYRGKYKAFLCESTTLHRDGKHPTGIQYLKQLGVTHIQLMPVYDYASVDEGMDDGGFNWGYDPLNYNVPEGSYATDPFHGEVRIREMKEMIQSLHRNGFSVIMDVVYNHTYSLDSWFQRTVPWYYYRVDGEGRPSNGSACGNDMASERAMCGRYILDSVLYWAREYHIDGFRFDLMGLLDVELLNRIRSALDNIYGRGNKLMFGEPWAADKTAIGSGAVQALKGNIRLLDINIGMFCDNTRDMVKGSVFELEEPGFVNGASGLEEQILNSVQAWIGRRGGKEPGVKELRVKAPSQVITYVSSHDNQTLWDKLSDTISDETLRRKAYRLAAGIYMTCQGRLFFLSGEEFARTKEGLDNTYNAPISLNRLDWNMTQKEESLVDYYRGLIALRKQLPGLCDKTENAWKRIFNQWKRDGAAGFSVHNSIDGGHSRWENLMVVYNSSQEEQEIRLPEGGWEILADGENSFLWKSPRAVRTRVKAAPVSILVLGKTLGIE